MNSAVLYKFHGLPEAEGEDQKKKLEEERNKVVTRRLMAILELGLIDATPATPVTPATTPQ